MLSCPRTKCNVIDGMNDLHDEYTITCDELQETLSPEDLKEFNEWLDSIWNESVETE